MNKIVDDCFSTTLVSGALTEDVECLKKHLMSLKFQKPLKMHITMKHLESRRLCKILKK
jgi:hypothetical protein